MNRPTLSTQIALFHALIEGIQKRFSSVAMLTLGSAPITPAALVALLQGLIDAYGVMLAARTQAHSATLAARAAARAARPVLRSLKTFLFGMFSDPKDLADFGLAPPRPRTPPTTAEAASAVVKREATRKARHTLGPKARKGVKGPSDTTVTATPPKP